MSCYSNKEKMECNDYKDICRNHSAKTEREILRVCPSKLSKRELEDLYFTLLENNLELKKTINGQQDKIRVLSTQVQRMTNTQERLVSKEVKDRGTATKAVVDEQKDFISELKDTNQRLTERIQFLNMRLCSAKQFMKTTPPQTAPFRGNRSAATAVSTPKKHDCLSKSPESSPEQVIKVSTFSQWEDKTPRKTNQTQNNVLVDKKPVKSDQLCDENKCRTLMEELKLKIATLQEELLKVHGEYATRIGRLETEVTEVRKENIRVISERSASELELTESFKRANDILAKHRAYEAKCSELAAELAIEKRKVAELETQLKAANMSDKVKKTIEDHLTTNQDPNPKCLKCCFKDQPDSEFPSPRMDEGLPPSGGATSLRGDPHTTSSTGDDSGYQDTEQALIKQNKELMEKVLELQRLVDCMRIGGYDGLPECQSESLSDLERSPAKTDDNSVATSGTPVVVDILKPSEVSEDKPDKLIPPQTKDKASTQTFLYGKPPKPSELSEDKPDKLNPPQTKDKASTQTLLYGKPPQPSEVSEDKPDKLIPPQTKDKASTQTPLFGKPPQAEIPVEQIEQSPKGDNSDHIISVASEMDLTKKVLRIETLDNPEETYRAPSVQWRMSEDTRARIIEEPDGTQYIADDPVKIPEIHGYPDIPNNDYREHSSRDSPKLKIVEKKKLEGSIPSIMSRTQGSRNISLKSTSFGPGFNPEKFKYLEAEGLTAETPRVSIAESVPSNPELGFGIPRLMPKSDQVRHKVDSDSPSISSPSILKPSDSVVARAIGRENLPASYPSTPAQTDDTEDCQNCAACSFDKECAHTIQPTMNKLALEMQKEQARKQDLNASSQTLTPMQLIDTDKKEKKRISISQLRKQKKGNKSVEELVVNPKVYAKQTSQTVGGPVNLPDVPLLEKREQSSNDYVIYKDSEIDKKRLTNDKNGKRKKVYKTGDNLSMTSTMFAQQTCQTVGGPINLPDVPLLEKAVGETRNFEPGKDSNEDKADTKQKQTEKSSQAPGYKAWQADVSVYRRRSGTYCYRRGLQSQDTFACSCDNQQDGACSHKPRNKGTQAVDKPVNASGRERRRAVSLSDRATYTLDSKPTATSPNNTDLEMSYLSDLPMEKEKKSPMKSRPLSPGEDKTSTFTSTSYGTSPATDYSLSEGEMPASNFKRRYSIPDEEWIFVNQTLAHKEETPPVQQMEAALQAITNELQRCKFLLHRHRPENLTRNSTVS